MTTGAFSLGSEAPPDYGIYNRDRGELTINWQMPRGQDSRAWQPETNDWLTCGP